MGYFWDTKTITIDAEEIIEQISSKTLDEEYKKRKDIQRTDPQRAINDERFRSDQIDVEINLDEYDLVERDSVEISDFSHKQAIDYLEELGYSVFENSCISSNECSGISKYMDEAPKWRFKDLLCDALGLSHLATKEEIISKISEKL